MKPWITIAAGTVAALGLAVSASSALACAPAGGYKAANRPITVLPPDALAKNAPAASKDVPKSIVGLWHIVHYGANHQQLIEAFQQWHADGTENELVNLPPALGSTCLGVWSQVGDQIQLYHTTWFYDPTGAYVGTMQFRATYHVHPDNNTFSGKFDEKDYDPNGNMFNETQGTAIAERLVSSQ